MHARSCLIAGLALSLAACGTVPMTAITRNGHTFHGTFTVGVPSSFEISDGRVTCAGRFPTFGGGGESHVFTLPMVCNHGLTGIATFLGTDKIYNGGGGTLRLSDGTDGTFITGAGAAAL